MNLLLKITSISAIVFTIGLGFTSIDANSMDNSNQIIENDKVIELVND